MFQVDVGFLKENPGEALRFGREGFLPPIGEGAETIQFRGPVRVNLELTSTENAILARGTVQVVAQLTCARCLEPFSFPLEAPFAEVYYFAGKGEEDWIFFTGPTINLEPEIIKAIILEIPMKAVCREECRGFCPDCGKNLNTGECRCGREKVEPRLAALADLLK